MKNILVLVCSSDCNTNDVIGIQLDKLGVNWLRVDEFVFAKRKKEIVNCVQKFADDESLKIYADVIIKRMKNEHIYKFDRYQYFSLPVFLERNHKEIFVDMGAFVGDTIEEYISTRMGAFGGVFAFEPYKPNFQAMNYRLERLKKEWAIGENKIFPILAGVGEKSKRMSISATTNNNDGLGAHMEMAGCGEECIIYALDDYFQEQKVDFLKADIESYELDMLKGAKNIIKRDIPMLAVCIYHNASDLYSIITYLDALDLGYKFSVRHYSYGYAETVLYAYH